MKSLTAFLRSTAVSTSGILLLLSIVCAYFLFVKTSNDIVALVIAFSLGGFLVFLGLLVLTYGKIFKQKFKFKISTATGSNTCYAKESTKFIINFNPVLLPPLCNVLLQLRFKHQNTPAYKVLISGISKNKNHVEWTHTFPHRGKWEIDSAICEFGDAFGIFKYNWNNNYQEESLLTLKVLPQQVGYMGLPALASTFKEGDTFLQPPKRAGDYFDFKKYQPSDGSRRILWKLYAKSNELMSRYPEEAVSPAGMAVLYCLANTEDDRLAQAFTKYISDLEQVEINIVAGCLGSKAFGLATNSYTTNDLLINSAWQANDSKTPAETVSEFEHFLNSANAHLKSAHIDTVIIFTSDKYLTKPQQLNSAKELGKYLQERRIKPIFCSLSESAMKHSKSPVKTPAYTKAKWYDGALNLLIKQDTRFKTNIDLTQLLANACKEQKWQIYNGKFGQ